MEIMDTLKGVLILDSEGNKILSRIFDESINVKAYERKLFVNTKTHKIKDEILILGNTLVVHKFITDVHFYVIGNRSENPLVLDAVLHCLIEVIESMANNKGVERQVILNNLAQSILALDEICDNGMVLETDSNLVIERVCPRGDPNDSTIAQKFEKVTGGFKLPWTYYS